MNTVRLSRVVFLLSIAVCTTFGCHAEKVEQVDRPEMKPNLTIEDVSKIKSAAPKAEVTVEMRLECLETSLLPSVITAGFERNKVSHGEFVSTPLKKSDRIPNQYHATLKLRFPPSKGKYTLTANAVFNDDAETTVTSKPIDVEVK